MPKTTSREPNHGSKGKGSITADSGLGPRLNLLSLFFFLALSPFHSFTLSLFLSLHSSLCLSFSLSFSLSFFLSLSLSRWRTHTHTNSHTHTLSFALRLFHNRGNSRIECSADLLTLASESTGIHEPVVGVESFGSVP